MFSEESSLVAVTPAISVDWFSGALAGDNVQRSRKSFAEVRHLFAEGESCSLDGGTELYNVVWTGTASAGTPGALLFGCTHLNPGQVNGEYFMTHGHFHADQSRDEMYLPVSGRGLLLQMDAGGRCWAEEMTPGKVHMIKGAHAHRVVNTGDVPLIFWASWPADAGYDYGTIARDGFGLRVFCRDGKAVLEPGRS